MREISEELNLSESRISQIHDYLIKRFAVMVATGMISNEVFYG